MTQRPLKQKGPTIQRGDAVDLSTTDQRLLDSRGPSDWVHTDPWRVMRIQAEFIEGFGALAETERWLAPQPAPGEVKRALADRLPEYRPAAG